MVASMLCLAGAWLWRDVALGGPTFAHQPPPRAPSVPERTFGGREGSFSVLTHNIAGGPRWLTRVPAARTAPAIAERLDGFDLVLLQEDHTQHATLKAGSHHAHASAVGALQRKLFGDGLARFSQMPFVPVAREAWRDCHGLWDAGHDCLAEKGFSRAETRLSDHASVDVYNVALDAGASEKDRATRARQLEQLAEALDTHSAGRPTLVAGDTALSPDSPEDARLLSDFLQRTGLRDACEALLCEAPSSARVLYRGSAELSLAPTHWEHARELEGISGHDAVSVRMRWRVEPPGQRAAILVR